MEAIDYAEQVEEQLYGNFDVAEGRALDIVFKRAKTMIRMRRWNYTPRMAADELARMYFLQPLARGVVTT